MQDVATEGVRYSPKAIGSGDVTKLKIPISNIYRFKQAFYKNLDVDKETLDAIRIYNLTKQGTI